MVNGTHFPDWLRLSISPSIGSALNVPMQVSGRSIGGMLISAPEHGAFREENVLAPGVRRPRTTNAAGQRAPVRLLWSEDEGENLTAAGTIE